MSSESVLMTNKVQSYPRPSFQRKRQEVGALLLAGTSVAALLTGGVVQPLRAADCGYDQNGYVYDCVGKGPGADGLLIGSTGNTRYVSGTDISLSGAIGGTVPVSFTALFQTDLSPVLNRVLAANAVLNQTTAPLVDDSGAAGLSTGAVDFTNTAALTLNEAALTADVQAWVGGAYVHSGGGPGTDASGLFADNGGRGGNGGAVTMTNSGVILADSKSNGNAFGIWAESSGGNGAVQQGTFGNQQGGQGGAAGSVMVTNTAGVSVSADRGTGSTIGIKALSRGGNGGDFSIAGGAGGTVSLTSTADVAATATGTRPTVAGIYAESIGGRGSDNNDDNSDRGGAGGTGGDVSVRVSTSRVKASGTGITAPSTVGVYPGYDEYQYYPYALGANAAVAALSTGGTSGEDQGTGGSTGSVNVTLEAAEIVADGNLVNGVVARTRSGNGQFGYGVIGGAGGAGGNTTLTMGTATTVGTSGEFAEGVVVSALGGSGGNFVNTGGFFGNQSAGNGGTAGLAAAYVGAKYDDALQAAVADPLGATITTSGNNSDALVVESVGGVGGVVTDFSGLFGGNVDQAGNGGRSYGAYLFANVTINTEGDNSRGILAQAVGGGGGTGGKLGGVLALAADGGDGGQADTAQAILSGSVTTQGAGSASVTVQSIGGGGGTGADSNGVIAVGGGGGTGGNAGVALVDLVNAFRISTQGDFSYGLLAQSVGHGGGDGGTSFSFAEGPPVAAVGGSGGGAGSGGDVRVRSTGAAQAALITTAGENADAVLAQSIGGGGGTGGSAYAVDIGPAAIAIGGSGGVGGNAGQVDVELSGTQLQTAAAHSFGIKAQSISGGGGSAGNATSFDAGLILATSFSLGGRGGVGGDSGDVSLALTGASVLTGGSVNGIDITSDEVTDAHGIVAQSVAGGGGVGGSSFAKSISIATVGVDEINGMTISGAVGGDGGGAGDAGRAVIDLSATDVMTSGDASVGVFAQSVAGGGGLGGTSSSDAELFGRLKTFNPDITGNSLTISFSIGGGGGNGGSSAGAAVRLADATAITTSGVDSHGVQLQSASGGGGNGSHAGASKGSFGAPGNTSVSVGIGGLGGGAGDAGPLAFAMDTTSTIATTGDGARGLMMQTIGNGGGSSSTMSFSGGPKALLQYSNVGLKVGRNAGGCGDGDTVVDCADGGDIETLGLAGQITTDGADADGVYIQTIGGSGGSGGSLGGKAGGGNNPLLTVSSLVSDFKKRYDFYISIGGEGGLGGDGGDIRAMNGGEGMRFSGAIGTTGDWSDGIVMQTIGGGGGTGGAAASQATLSVVRPYVAVGGAGGAGGNGGIIEYGFDGGTIMTEGRGANGIVMQTIGGGGGMGGSASRYICGKFNVGGAALAAFDTLPFDPNDADDDTRDDCLQFDSFLSRLTPADDKDGVIGDGGIIRSRTDSTNIIAISTKGDYAHGIVAQSIGGGGGTVGFGASVLEGDDGSEVAVENDLYGQLGGLRGTSGNGGEITLSDRYAITTKGAGAMGIIAQSIGGGGGLAAAQGLNQAILGSEGYVGAGGTVSATVRTGSYISTVGRTAHGIVAQSVAAGGGVAIGAVGGTSTRTIDPRSLPDNDDFWDDYALTPGVQLGAIKGFSSQGNIGAGDATVILPASNAEGQAIVTTEGDNSRGIIVQSIGGGGGVMAGIPDEAGDGTSNFAFLTLGRLTDAGEDFDVIAPAKVAEAQIGGAVLTQGDGADAVLVQAISDGGGVADIPQAPNTGFTTYLGNQTNTTMSSETESAARAVLDGAFLTTAGDRASALVVQAIGGGGGLVDFVGAKGGVVLGSNGVGGQAGPASVTGHALAFATSGADAPAIIAQSIGGGGGIFRSEGGALDLTLGSRGGSAGAVTVDLTTEGGIVTDGVNSYAILAQSVGGGGGIAFNGATEFASTRIGRASGDGGAVDVTLGGPGTVLTTGDGAHAIVAQSVGGGGGIFGGTGTGTLDLSEVGYASSNSRGNAIGGTVTVELDTDVTTLGQAAYGIFAQSVGGGGGFGTLVSPLSPLAGGSGFAGTTGGDDGEENAFRYASEVGVTQAVGSTIRTTGAESVGIFAQGQSAYGARAIDVSVDGTVIGGSAGGAGVVISGGAANTLAVGETGALSALSGTAIRFEPSESDTSLDVQNAGLIDGDVLGGAVAAAQARGAASSPSLTLANTETGILTGAERYEADVINAGTLVLDRTVSVAGAFAQGAGGVTIASADFAAGTGSRLIIDGDAVLGGDLQIRASSIVKDRAVSLLAAGGQVEGRFDSVTSSLFVYEQQVTDRGLAIAVRDHRFVDGGFRLSDANRDIAAHFGRIFESGDAAYGALFAELDNAARAGTYGGVLEVASPGAALAAGAAQLRQASQRMDTLFTCGAGRSAPGEVEEKEGCGRFVSTFEHARQDGSGKSTGYDGTFTTVEGGASVDVGDDWRLSFNLGYQRADLDGRDATGRVEGDMITAGAALSRSFGGLTLSAAGSLGIGSYDTERHAILGDVGGTAKGSYDAVSVAARLRAAYTQTFAGGTYLAPRVDLDIVHVATDGFEETGAGALNLRYEDADMTAFILSPMLEVGATSAFGQDGTLRTFASAGFSASTADSFDTDVRLAGADSSAGDFGTAIGNDPLVGRFGLGLEIARANSLTLSVRYDAAISDETVSHSGMLQVGYRF